MLESTAGLNVAVGQPAPKLGDDGREVTSFVAGLAALCQEENKLISLRVFSMISSLVIIAVPL